MHEPTLFDKEVTAAIQNRNDNYYENIFPQLTKRESEVLEAVRKLQPCTMHQVAKYLGREVHTISGRFSALVKKEQLKIKGKIYNKSLYGVK